MKIGILTFWEAENNYGQLLQAFALQKYLRDMGHNVFLIKYRRENDIISLPLPHKVLKVLHPKKLWQFVVSKIKDSCLKKERLKNPRCFEEFRKKYIVFGSKEYSSYADLKGNPPDAEMYIVGSDQVWNFFSLETKRVRNLIHAYFLDFGSKNVKRVSYAASWGRSDVLNDEKSEIASLIQRFDLITVREKSGVDICNSFGVKSKWVCDPTMLFDAEIYRMLYKNEKAVAPRRPYLFFYYLNGDGDFDKKSVWKFAKTRGLEVQYVSGNSNFDRLEKKFPTIPEWLALVDGAEYVITDSFHACVFSILFKKKFGVIRLVKASSGRNVRLSSLFEMTACDERYISDGDFSVLDKVYDVDFSFREKSMKILKTFIGR